MRFGRVFLSVLVSVIWLGTSHAQDALPPDRGIEQTITAQIDAFLADDFAEAFTYASPNIQGIFGSSERFGQMVRNGFPMVWRPGDVQYLELRDVAGNLWQKVLIQDRKGGTHILDYQMIQTGEGWKINGVQILEAPDVAA